MSSLIYYIITGALSVAILYGISRMSQVKTAVGGNLLNSVATAAAIIITLVYFDVFSETTALYIILACIAVGTGIGLYLARTVQMIQMPELVGMLNGIGGAASALVGGSALFTSAAVFELSTAAIALGVGTLTFTGSVIAAGKLSGKINGRPIVWKNHQALTSLATILVVAAIVLTPIVNIPTLSVFIVAAIAGFLGIAIAIRVGGADMPITISLLNSLSGVAGSIAGMAIGNILLVAVGGIVGASGLLLTQIMCRAMNSSLADILQGKTSTTTKKPATSQKKKQQSAQETETQKADPASVLANAKKVIIVPGYGMAIAQAQHLVKQLADNLEQNGTEVKYAIHPVAGRMPGHMNVLLSEADVPYEQLYEMDDVNDEFADCDACVVVGANDVLNPAARDTDDTPISGMPILNVDEAKHIIICNYDLKPGYAGVENPIYKKEDGVSFLLGDAAETLQQLLNDLKGAGKTRETETETDSGAASVLAEAKKVIIVPGYGMAIAQAQHLVKQLADNLEQNGTEVKYAIHPVAGRMPGHMNVLLSEADVPYEQLYEMDDVNDEFADCDACVVVGANDVLNPAARDSDDTPISGMPILNVDEAKHIIICNYDLKPGYAGVENPIYKKEDGVSFLLGDAAETLQQLLNDLKGAGKTSETETDSGAASVLADAKKVIIVPGYGMAIAQAQHLVKQLADNLEQNGAEVKYAIHPVAGRMPGHMNVLLSEADVPYEQLYEMDDVNDEFADCDACVVVGANDVLNPAARDTDDTPISGMPILNVDEAKHIIICNYDLKPGYAGVENPIYKKEDGVSFLLGDAAETLQQLLNDLKGAGKTNETETDSGAASVLAEAKKVIIVPGYGMAIAQAQHLVKQLADNLEQNGAEVKYAIHPVAGRMPGHMNVLLSEADVPYEQLYEMDDVNDEFADCDACVVVGANDVLNPAARDTDDTPISGMPILNVDEAKHIIICNYDLKPGYAGVENPIYKKEDGVSFLLGDAAETLQQLLNDLKVAGKTRETETETDSGAASVLAEAKKVIIVPGYGMAIAQAQHLVKQLADNLEQNGTEVKYAIHPVAGRMPGHMNVLLSEADVPYEQLYEMDDVNDEFADCDACVVVGANDVLNPAARDSDDTPISGMPILNVDEAKHIIICNYDLKPGYAGVENPIYKKEDGVSFLLG